MLLGEVVLCGNLPTNSPASTVDPSRTATGAHADGRPSRTDPATRPGSVARAAPDRQIGCRVEAAHLLAGLGYEPLHHWRGLRNGLQQLDRVGTGPSGGVDHLVQVEHGR